MSDIVCLSCVGSRRGMATKPVRALNNHVLIAAGLTLLLLAAFGAWTATASNPYSIPVASRVVMFGARDAVLGTALLFVALRKSRFTSATAVIAATILMFGVAMKTMATAAFGLAFPLGWAGHSIWQSQQQSLGRYCSLGIRALTNRCFSGWA